METEYQLINVIKSGDFENASALVNRVFEDNITKTALSTDMLRCFMFDMVSTVLKTVPEIGNMNGSSLLKDLDIVNRLVCCEKLLEMKHEMLEILKAICTFVRQNTKDKKEEFIDKVVRYVQSHFSDVNLSVSVIANDFAITPHYLTRIFKEKTGSGLFEYITSFRLEKAKELLKHQEYSIKDIAEMVGYYNSNVFIRAFKKNAGVTPGMFKDLS
jgi:YesN/AraC family two-component response regulator